MSTESELPVEERILQVLQHLGIQKAHFAGRNLGDWSDLASRHPEVITSMTLLCPTGVDPDTVGGIASRILVFNGDQGRTAESVRGVMESVPDATIVTLRDYPVVPWSDVAADRTEDIGSGMMNFLARMNTPDSGNTAPPAQMDGEIAGIAYRVQGSGPPLVLLPLWLSPSQWEPLLPRLSEHYRTITLGGTHL